MLNKLSLLFALIFVVSCSSVPTYEYPAHWWSEISDKEAPKWEILPQSGQKGKSVILSKRNELGILSNFAHTPFTYEGKRYESVEGLWQSMKFPEDKRDPRWNAAGVSWKLKRNKVEQMVAFEAKRAGSEGSKNMRAMGINWVSFKGKKMTYRTSKKGEHYRLIKKIMTAKLKQNPEVQKVLLSTGNLVLLPDHKTRPNNPPAWKYNQIWMELREKLKKRKL